MMGDASDNIPGLPGVGAKTAAKLLAQFDSLEGTIAHADEIKGKLGERIREHKAQGIMSKELARIITDVPVTLDVDGLLRKAADEPALTALLEVLEFRSLARRILPAVSASRIPTSSTAQTSKKGGRIGTINRWPNGYVCHGFRE